MMPTLSSQLLPVDCINDADVKLANIGLQYT